MKANKAEVKNLVANEIGDYVNPRRAIEATKKAKLSGTAIKTGVGGNGGIYPVGNALNGTGVITRIALSLALKRNNLSLTDKIRSSEISESFKEISESILFSDDKKTVSEGKNPLGKKIVELLKTTGKPYRNFKTLKNRLISDINAGLILGFAFKEPESSEVKAIFNRI